MGPLAAEVRSESGEAFGDLGDGVLAGVVHLLGLVELALGELGTASADPAASAAMMRKNSRPIGVEVETGRGCLGRVPDGV